MRFTDAVRRLEALPDPLPDFPPELMPVPAGPGRLRLLGEDRLRAPDGRPLREAAVLVLVHPDGAGDACVVLTERVAYDGHHSGEVSFPGGKPEPGDADATATALREAAEEVGLDPAACGLRVVGCLGRVPITVSGYAITPVLALASSTPALTADPSEVARIVHAPVAAFLPAAPRPVVERRQGGHDLRYAIYPVDGLEVWGATARILGQLGAVVAGLDASSPGR